MANVIRPKRSNTASNVPTTANLSSGELAVNMADQKIYINNGTSIVQVGAGTLSSLSGVAITTPATNQVLQYNGTNWINATASGSGTVTSITAGTGLSGGTITTTGTIALANTAVTAGSYTTANITVDAQGRITAASSGTSGVSSVTGTAPIVSSGGATPAISISQATTSSNGYLTSTDWNTFNNKTSNTGTVTSVSATAGTGISISGSPITTSGTLTITNTAPDQVVAFTNGTGISVTGTYPNFTVTNTAPSSGGTVTSVSGTGTASGLTLSGTVTTSGNITLSGTVNSLAAGSYGISVTGSSASCTGNAATATTATSVASITSGQVTSALGYTPYNSTNPSGYITSSGSISGTSLAIAFNDGPRNLSNRLPNTNPRSVYWDFVNAGTAGTAGNYAGVMTFTPWDGTSASTGDSSYQLGFGNQSGVNASGPPALVVRNGINSTWNSWYTVMTSANIASQSVNYATSAGSATSATTASSCSGNAATATTASNTSSISSAVGSGNTWTGVQLFNANQNTATGSNPPLQAYGTSSGAMMSFHRGGYYAVNMGLDSDNVMRIGGWSAAANRWQLDMSGNETIAGAYNGAGTGLTGTAASLSIGGNAATATTATGLNSSNYISRTGSSGNLNTDFQNTPAGSFRYQGDDAGGTNSPGGTWWIYQNMRHSNGSSYWGTQVAWGWEDNANKLATRNVQGGTFGSWVYYINSANVGSYAVSSITAGTGITVSASQGAVTISASVTSPIPAGTVMLFYQSAAPTGWTQVTTQNNKALRVVSGAGGVAGGSVAFSTAFASQAVSGTVGAIGATTLSVAQMPSHAHFSGYRFPGCYYAAVALAYGYGNGAPDTIDTGTQGGGGSHTHGTPTFSGTAINLAVQYIDVIICSKN